MTLARLPARLLDDAFALPSQGYIYIIGGGGKTTLMFSLARHLASTGRTVVSTTTTKILYPSSEESTSVIVEDAPVSAAARLRSELPEKRHVTIAKTVRPDNRKLKGYRPDELDSLWQAGIANYMLVEADGAAGRSVKAHNDYEPVLSRGAELLIAVIGADCIGRPLADADVHRAERFAKLLDREMGVPVTVEDIAAIFFHPLGYLKAVPAEADVIVLVSKAGPDPQRRNAERLASALHAADANDRIARIVIAELAGPSPLLTLAGRAQ